MNTIKRSESDIKQLNFEEKVLNTSCLNALNALKCEDIKLLIKDLDNKRKEEVLNFQKRQSLIQQSVVQLHKNVSSVDKLKNMDLAFYERHVQDICNQISLFKDSFKENFFYLINQQSMLEEELKYVESICNKLDTPAFYKSLKSNTFTKPKTQKHKLNMNKDVENFQDFLIRNGGHTGGWGEEEHRIFKKYLHKYGMHDFNQDLSKEFNENEQEFLKEFQRIVPEKSIEDILSHLIWNSKYEELKHKQSEAIYRWKTVKEFNDTLKHFDNNSTEHNKKNVGSKSIDVKEELKRWQAKKESDRKAEIEFKADDAIVKREIEVKMENNRKNDKKMITQWLEAKKREVENDWRTKVEETFVEKKTKSAFANKKIKEFRYRDQEFINERVKIVKEHQSKRLSKSLSSWSIKSKVNAKNDPQFRRGSYANTTEQWNRRIAKNETLSIKIQSSSVNAIDEIPKLKVPNWRQGLTN